MVGATLLALGHHIFTGWVATNPEGAGPTDRDDKAAWIRLPRPPGKIAVTDGGFGNETLWAHAHAEHQTSMR